MRKIFIVILFNVFCYSSLNAQSSYWTHIKNYSHINLYFNIKIEFPLVLLGQPFTVENIREYTENELSAAGINYTETDNIAETPLLIITEGDNGTANETYNDCNCDCNYFAQAESYYVEIRIIDKIEGDMMITYQLLNNVITVGTGGRAASAWSKLKSELNEFIGDWKQAH